MSNAEVLDRLFATIEGRRDADPDSSWTAQLFAEGRPKIVRKFGEEAVEVTVAALVEGREALTAESADLLYHLLVVWADAGIQAQDVWDALAEREGTSGIFEKQSRSDT